MIIDDGSKRSNFQEVQVSQGGPPFQTAFPRGPCVGTPRPMSHCSVGQTTNALSSSRLLRASRVRHNISRHSDRGHARTLSHHVTGVTASSFVNSPDTLVCRHLGRFGHLHVLLHLCSI